MAWKTVDETAPSGVTLSFEGSSIAYPDGITREEIVEFSKNKGLGLYPGPIIRISVKLVLAGA